MYRISQQAAAKQAPDPAAAPHRSARLPERKSSSATISSRNCSRMSRMTATMMA